MTASPMSGRFADSRRPRRRAGAALPSFASTTTLARSSAVLIGSLCRMFSRWLAVFDEAAGATMRPPSAKLQQPRVQRRRR